MREDRHQNAVGLSILTVLIIFLMSASSQLLAQGEPRAWAHFFGGIGGITGQGESEGILHVGGGGEGLIASGFGVTGEIGYLALMRGFGGGVGVFSLGGLYAFNRDRKTVPFVNGGYTLFFRSGHEHGFFVGGGVNHWIGERWGIRIEGRDQVFRDDTAVHALEAKFAIILK